MNLQDYRNLQFVLKHYLELTKVKYKNDPIRRTAQRIADLVERKINAN